MTKLLTAAMKDSQFSSLILSWLCEVGRQPLKEQKQEERELLDPPAAFPLMRNNHVFLLTHLCHSGSNSGSFNLCKNCCVSVDFIGGFLIHPLGRKSVHCSCTSEVTEEEGGTGQAHAHRKTAGRQAPSCLGYAERSVSWQVQKC